MSTLKDCTALVTGAAAGIGRLLALKLAGRGARIVAWDRDAAGLARLKSEIEALGGRADVRVCDLARRDAIDAAVGELARQGCQVDVLINNAGVVNGKPLLDCSDDEIERTFSINTLAPIRTTRAFLPGMMARGRGHIVNIASAAGLAGVPRLADYSASKFALVGFDEALRLELRLQRSPVVTTIVCPYYIDTGMFRGVRTRFPWLLPILEPDDVAERIVRAIVTDRRRLLLPRFVLAPLLIRALPPRAFDLVMDFFGVSHSMDSFRGRNPDAADVKSRPRRFAGE